MIYKTRARMLIGRVNFFTRRQGKNTKAQSALEFALVIVCVVAALLAMGKYIRRGMQGRLRLNVEPLGKQYDPNTTSGSYVTTANSSSRLVTATQTEKRVYIDLDEDGVLEDVVFGRNSTNTFSSNATESGHEVTDR